MARRFNRCTFTLGIAAATFAGCGASQPPIGAPGAIPQQSAIAAHAERGKSWMLPEAKTEDLLYVSSNDQGAVYVYTYPEGKIVGTLSGLVNAQESARIRQATFLSRATAQSLARSTSTPTVARSR
jgi:hypothetical protein